MFLLSLFLACDDPSIAPSFNAAEISPVEKYQELETEIQQALLDWENGNREEARSKLLKTYHNSFQEIQPQLAQNDRLGLIQIELTFGQTLKRMKSLRSKGREEQGVALLKILQEEILSLPNANPQVSEEKD